MELQLDLFSTSNTDFEEERKEQEKQRNITLAIERKLKERQELMKILMMKPLECYLLQILLHLRNYIVK